MSKPSAPKPPDPNKVASAQTATNIGTAVANTAAGQVNQVTPEGSLTYNQRGTYEYQDPVSDRVHTIPLYTAETKLSPENEKIFALNKSAEQGLARTAAGQANFLAGYLDKPANFDTSAIEGRLFDLGKRKLDPMFEERGDALRSRLVNQGIREGSRAWNSEMRNFDTSRDEAYNNLLLQGRGQAFQEIAASRNQPINEITALLSGSQVAAPQFNIATPDKAATTDYAGIVAKNFDQRMEVYKAKSENFNQLMGGLFQMAGTGAMMMSDRRTKKDIHKIGETFAPIPVYSFKYKGSDKPQVGVMADEVPPDMTVTRPDGLKMVDYSRLG